MPKIEVTAEMVLKRDTVLVYTFSGESTEAGRSMVAGLPDFKDEFYTLVTYEALTPYSPAVGSFQVTDPNNLWHMLAWFYELARLHGADVTETGAPKLKARPKRDTED